MYIHVEEFCKDPKVLKKIQEERKKLHNVFSNVPTGKYIESQFLAEEVILMSL